VTGFKLALDSKAAPVRPSSAVANSLRIWLNGDVVGAHPGWNDTSPGPTITVFSGETVSLSLNATDGITHNWFIDTNNNFTPDPNEISSPDFSASTKVLSFNFTPVIGQNIPSAGNWTYRCKYHPTSMYGTIRVTQPPDFSLSASPPSLAATVGNPETSIITVHPFFSFTGTVNLSATGPNGLLATITPSSVAGTSGTATLTVTVFSAGNYTATVTGTSGSLSRSLNVTVEAGDFTLNPDPAIASAQINTVASSTITVGTINHFAGAINLTSDNTSCTFTPTMVVGLGLSTLSCTFVSSGQFVINVTAMSGSLAHSVTVTFDVAVPDYLVASGPKAESELAGQTGNSTITVQSINGFTGIVNLSESASQGLNCTLSSTSITLGASGKVTLSCSGNAGVYIATVTGTSGVTSRSSSVSYTVQDFTITTSSTIVAVDASAAATPTILIVPLEDFGGTVSVKVAASAGLTATVSPSSITGGSGITTLTLSATSAGNYTASVTATSSTLTHSLKLTTQVQDFTIISSPTMFDVNVKQARTSSIRISSINHFAKTVTLTTNNANCDIAPVEITNFNNATLSCNFPVEGTFHINVTGTGGSLSHSVTVTYVASNVQQVPEAGLLGLLPITALIAGIALVGAFAYLFTRYRAAVRRRTTANL